MKRRITVLALAALLCLAFAVPALAANVFAFTEKSISLFEGESVQTALRREGNFEGDGEISYDSSKPSVATVSEDGTVSAVGKGQTVVSASLNRNGKRVGRATVTVKVLRRVNKVTLNTVNLSVYEPDDPAVAELLREPTENQVLVIPAGAGINLSTTCTPEDASSRAVTYTSTDAGVARVSGKALKAIQRGECDLVVASVQNPEITETFRVLVIQPVKKITISAGDRKVAAGSVLQMSAECAPDNASIPEVTWASKNPAVATVDENGTVTGLKKGSATITATAADGSKVVGSVTLTVTQPVSSIVFSQTEIPVIVGRTAQAKVTVQPADATDKGLVWSSSDDTIATVQAGRITGKKAGVCIVTCASKSNPDVAAEVTVNVSQLVTKVECTTPEGERSLRTGESMQLHWNVLPYDATDKGLSFKSSAPKVATVDSNGIVTAVGRGTATITATAQDASRRQGTVRVTVIQPVNGISLQRPLYYVQRGGGTNLRAVIEPRNANNQKVNWYSDNESIFTTRSNGTSTGYLRGVSNGTATVTAVSEDGGYSATAQVRVGSFNEAVMVEAVEILSNNDIRIILRNMTQDMTFINVHFRVECFDTAGNPMVCNTDGVSTYFDGDYTYTLYPLERTAYGAFTFKNRAIDQDVGSVIVTITGWRDMDNYNWNIPEENQVRTQWNRYNYNNNNPDQGVG